MCSAESQPTVIASWRKRNRKSVSFSRKLVSSQLSETGSKKNLTKSLAPTDRIALVSPENESLTVKRQCELAEVNRSSVYRVHTKAVRDPCHGESSENLDLMRILDQTHLTHPAWGYRKLTDYVRHTLGFRVNRKRIRRLLRLMDITALFPGPNLSKQIGRASCRERV